MFSFRVHRKQIIRVWTVFGARLHFRLSTGRKPERSRHERFFVSYNNKKKLCGISNIPHFSSHNWIFYFLLNPSQIDLQLFWFHLSLNSLENTLSLLNTKPFGLPRGKNRKQGRYFQEKDRRGRENFLKLSNYKFKATKTVMKRRSIFQTGINILDLMSKKEEISINVSCTWRKIVPEQYAEFVRFSKLHDVVDASNLAERD